MAALSALVEFNELVVIAGTQSGFASDSAVFTKTLLVTSLEALKSLVASLVSLAGKSLFLTVFNHALVHGWIGSQFNIL